MVGTSDPGSLSSCYPPRSAASNAISKRWHEDVLSNPLDGALARGPRFGGGLGNQGPGEHGHSSAQQQGPSQVSPPVHSWLSVRPCICLGATAVQRWPQGKPCCCTTHKPLITQVTI